MNARDTGDDSFASLFEFLPIGAYRCAPDGRPLRANPALVRMNGHASEAEMLAQVGDLGREWYVQPGRRQAFLDRLFRDGHVTAFESEVRHYRSGEHRWVSEQAHGVYDAQGRLRYYEGTVEDITERVRERERLQRSEDNLRQVAAHVPGALYRLVLDGPQTPRVDYISDGIRTLLGLEPGDVTSRRGRIRELRHPDDVERVDRELAEANRLDRPLLTEYRVCLPDGSEKWIQQRSSPVVGGGELPVRVGVLLDITDRKRAEALLRSSEARWKLALDSTGDGVWDWNLATGEELLSRRCLEMYGFDEHELESRPEALDSRTHPDDLEAMHRARDEHLAGRTPSYVNEHRVQCKDGRWKWVLSRGMVIERDADGRPLRMIGTHTDITARKQAEALRLERDRAAAADLAKSQFLSRVSHELRTPLNAILGFSQLLEMELASQGRAEAREASWLGHVLASGRHLLGLMDDILDLSSAQTGQLRVELEPVPLAGVLDEAATMLAASAAEAGIRFEVVDRPGPGLAVLADRKRLRQVLVNLLSNAIKYNRPEGWVRVQVAAAVDDDAVHIAVVDGGRGLDASQRARLFQPFERLGAQRGPVPGTGLGLALSRQLVEAMGGRIDVDSEPGTGSTFTVTLPRA